MATDKLYWQDPFANDFEATRAELATFAGRPSIVLERTLFYPEAGGQLADNGSLTIALASGKERTLAIDDVQIDDDGTIHHLSAELAPDIALTDIALAAGARGTIDRARRRDQTTQHTAQHMLSRALVDIARAETLSARLGATTCTIDVDKAKIDERDVARAEDLVNAVVTGDVDVRQLFPSASELAKLPLRRAPKVTENVRVIEIDGFDLSPCGGTHCTRTGQIGVVRVAGVERYKGGLRVSFHAGKRAIDDARKKEKVLSDLAKEFTCGALDVGAAVAKLRADLKARVDMLAAARGELVNLVAKELLAAHAPDASGTTRVAVFREKDDLGTLRALAGRLTSRPDVVAICYAPDEASPENLAIVVQRGATASFDCGAWLKDLCAKHGGKGGGRPERAEGRIPKGADLR
jgi:alanyl-tRNA synthetase